LVVAAQALVSFQLVFSLAELVVWVWLQMNDHRGHGTCRSKQEVVVARVHQRALALVEAEEVVQVCWRRFRGRQREPSLVVCHVVVEQATNLVSY